MAKLKNPLLSLKASGTLAKTLTFLRRRGVDLVEKKPEILDVKSAGQLGWRHMFNKCVDLWHTLSVAEKADWESAARPKHMTGYAWYISQCLRPNPGIYLPLQGGTMSGDIDMAKHRVLKLPAPTDSQEATRKAYVDALEARYQIGARVYHNVNQSIPNATPTYLSFDSEHYDNDAIHDNVVFNSRLTCKTAGVYVIAFSGLFAAAVGGIRQFWIKYNTITTISYNSLALDPNDMAPTVLATIWPLNVNDFLEIGVYQTSGAPLNIARFVTYSPEFMMQRIG